MKHFYFTSILAALLLTSVQAQGAHVLAVSNPSAPVLESDPPVGHIYGLTHDLSAASLSFDTSGGPVRLEYLRLDSAGNGYLTFDDGAMENAPGGVLVIEDILERLGDSYDSERDQLLSGPQTGLVDPKDVALLDDVGLMLVVDFGTGLISAFNRYDRGDTAPLFVLDDLAMSLEMDMDSEVASDEAGSEGDLEASEMTAADPGEPMPWGLAVDEAAGRLFVTVTDGTVYVYDDVLINQGRDGPTRVFTPTVNGKAAANLHGVAYLPGEDVLVVTDFGPSKDADEAGFAEDGKLYIIDNASTAEGDTEVRLAVQGPATLLGNPSGVVVDGESVYLGEKTKDIVLRFDDLFDLSGVQELTPSAAITVTKPESLVVLPEN